jgi:hypothetical protein
MGLPDDEKRHTDVRMRKSRDGDGLVVYGTCHYVLTVSVTALEKLLDGTVDSIHFSKYARVLCTVGVRA